MKRLYIFTSEPSNFVPEELKKAGDSIGIESKIIDLNHVVLIEGIKEGQLESGIFCVDKPKEGESSLKKLEICDQTVIIPRLNEHHLDSKIAILQRAHSLGATLLNTPESMEACNDKLMTHVMLNDSGIKSPFSFTLMNVDDVEATVDWLEKEGKLKYPIIVKTLRGTHGIGVMKLDSRASLVSVAQTLQKQSMDFIVQEFLEHDQSARMIMIGDKLLAANLRGQPKDKGEFRTNSHLGSETEQYNPSEDEIALGARIVEIFGCNFCAIDYIIKDRENGNRDIIILEVNGSPGLENIQKNWPDRNLALEVVNYACNKSNNEICPPVNSQEQASTIEVSSEPQPQELPKTDNVIQDSEEVIIHRIIDEPCHSRVDTGANYCSLHADHVEFDNEWTKFRRGDITFKVNTSKTIKIKNVHTNECTQRPVVKLDVTIKGNRYNGVEFTINNRQNMNYEILVGRKLLELVGLPIIVPSKELTPTDKESDEIQVEEE